MVADGRPLARDFRRVKSEGPAAGATRPSDTLSMPAGDGDRRLTFSHDLRVVNNFRMRGNTKGLAEAGPDISPLKDRVAFAQGVEWS